jgi:hypothetical protein
MDTQFFTIDVLKTLAGIVAAIILVVQFTKNPLDVIYNKICGLFKIQSSGFPTQLWTVILSELMLFSVMYFSGQLNSNMDVFLTSINALICAASAMKAFESMEKSSDTSTEENKVE